MSGSTVAAGVFSAINTVIWLVVLGWGVYIGKEIGYTVAIQQIIDTPLYLWTTLCIGVLIMILAAAGAAEEDDSSTKDDSAYALRVMCAVVAAAFVGCRAFHLFKFNALRNNIKLWYTYLSYRENIIIRGNEVLPVVCLGLALGSV